MSAEDNLSGAQWSQPELTFAVHRGVRTKPEKGKGLGMHWSADEHVAEDFSGINLHPEKSRVLHAEVPISSVQTDTETLHDLNAMDHPDEKEVTVVRGAPVKVTGVSSFREIPGRRVKKRTRTYNPPREVKA
jgi:hypothetical protein